MRKKVDPLTKAMILQAKRSAADQAADQVVRLLLAMPVYVLHDKWGFGNKRCERFAADLLELYDAYKRDYVTLDDLMQVLADEAGMTIMRGDNCEQK